MKCPSTNINAESSVKPAKFSSAPSRNKTHLSVPIVEVKISIKFFLCRHRFVWADFRQAAGPAAGGKKDVTPLPVPKQVLAAKIHEIRARRKDIFPSHFLHEKMKYIYD